MPTFTELGLPPGDLPTWNALFAPAGTPADTTARIASAVAAALKDPAVRATLEANGADPIGSTPAQLGAAVETATAAWRRFVRDYSIPQE